MLKILSFRGDVRQLFEVFSMDLKFGTSTYKRKGRRIFTRGLFFINNPLACSKGDYALHKIVYIQIKLPLKSIKQDALPVAGRKKKDISLVESDVNVTFGQWNVFFFSSSERKCSPLMSRILSHNPFTMGTWRPIIIRYKCL